MRKRAARVVDLKNMENMEKDMDQLQSNHQKELNWM